MERGRLNVLLIGESEQGWWQLAKHLEQLGCHWWFASTIEEIEALLEVRSIQLVLSTRPVTEGSPLMELLSQPDCSVFYSYPVEDSYLWFQAVPDRRGRLRASALRPSEFAGILDDLVVELQRSIGSGQGDQLVKVSAAGAPS